MKTLHQLTAALFLSFTLVASATTRYVDVNSSNAASPYLDWSTAATNIQDAVDVAAAGDEVVVTNGVYQAGGRAVVGLMTNRVVVNKPLTLRSVNGPEFTIIQGYQVPGMTNGDGAVRCIYLTNGASLFGFTLTHGATRALGWDWPPTEAGGGGIWCESDDVLISNCVLIANSAYRAGGGVYRGTLLNCTLSRNTATQIGESPYGGAGGGAIYSTLIGCTVARNSSAESAGGVFNCTSINCLVINNSAGGSGGGARYGTLINCSVIGNSAISTSGFYLGSGGGISDGTASNCLVVSNSVNGTGGGMFYCQANNCTVVGNSARVCGGISDGRATNCIIYFNKATTAPNYMDNLWGPLNHCSTTPMPSYDVGNITNTPDFLNLTGGDFRVQSNSPCINAGNNAYAPAGPDLDGNPRIVGGTVDMGAYECQSPALLDYYTWLQGFGLPTSAATAYADSDGEGMNNWQEWRADTIPTNALSLLKMISVTNDTPGLRVAWQSVPTRTYWLERATNLASPPSFSSLTSNLIGQVGMTTYTDTNATGPGPFFYRVGVQPQP